MAKGSGSLLDQGIKYLDGGRIKDAEECFRRLALREPTPQVLNNWAICRLLAGDPADALRLITPLLGDPTPAPFTRALACRAAAARGDEIGARRYLEQAIRDLEAGLPRVGTPDPDWVAYTIPVKQAAAALGDHRLVLDLHGRWPGRELALGAHLAAVAAFNLGKFEQAARYWERIQDPAWRRMTPAYAGVAMEIQSGLVPRFQLEYDPEAGMAPPEATEAAVAAHAAIGNVRIRMLDVALHTDSEEAGQTLATLIHYGGDWGLDLGQRLLAGSHVPIPQKMAAARALTGRGIFEPNQPIPIIHEGRRTEIVVREMMIRAGQDRALDQVVAEAARLKRAGKLDEACRLLADLQSERAIAYPPAMLALANLMWELGDRPAAISQLETLDRLFPDHPAVLLSLAQMWALQEELEKARRYLGRVDPRKVTPEQQPLFAALQGLLDEQRALDAAIIGDLTREEQEERLINPALTIRAALRQLPVQWLDGAVQAHGLAHARLRADREKELVKALQDPVHLRQVLAAEAPAVRGALRDLLAEGGVGKLHVLARRHGAMDGDGFWWDEAPPASPLGRLLYLAVAFVGRAPVGGKLHKVLVVPPELCKRLADCF